MAGEQISRPGRYEGYGAPMFDGHQRSSVYVPMRDGVRLAIDIVRPTDGGELHGEPLPVLWSHTPYTRSAITEDGEPTASVVEGWGRMLPVLSHGYVIAQVDARGGGASFGRSNGPFSTAETDDAYEITEWLAAQDFCDGNIGMWGRSYLGITQLLCASRQPPHLKAIFPEMAWWDAYDVMHPGGILRDDLAAMWSAGVRGLDLGFPMVSADAHGEFAVAMPTAPVDADGDGSLIRAARREHHWNRDVFGMVSANPYRDSVDVDGDPAWPQRSPGELRDAIAASGVAIYNYVGWYDGFTRDACLAFADLPNPSKLLIDPNYHSEYFLPSLAPESHGAGLRPQFDLAAEQRRWFDHWLKGIENGVMDEPPVTYWLMGADDSPSWRSAATWPPQESSTEVWYFGPGPSGSVRSINDGRLEPSITASGADGYTVDFRATTGLANRWANLYGGEGRVRPVEDGWHLGYPDMAANDAMGLTYTSEPFDGEVELVGHPIVRIVVEAETDADLFCYLEEVMSDGFSRYLSEGCLRLSHRAEDPKVAGRVGLPVHRSRAADVLGPATEATAVAFDLQPVGTVVGAGSRLRVTITGADVASHAPIDTEDPPTFKILLGGIDGSRIELPVHTGDT